MEHRFSLFPDDILPVEKAITNMGGIEARAVDRFFRGQRLVATTLDELQDNYECDESACLGFMEPEEEMSRVEWQHHDPDLATEAAILLREGLRR